jgi:hypothetical protein
LISDYGSYQLFDISEVPPEVASESGVEVLETLDTVFLQSGVLHTEQSGNGAVNKRGVAKSGRELQLVQFSGPVRREWVASLEARGGRVVAYVPQNAYLVYGEWAALSRLQGSGSKEIQWHGRLEVEHKLAPEASKVRSLLLEGAPPEGVQLYAVQMVSDLESNSVTLGLMTQLGRYPIYSPRAVLNYVNVVVPLAAADLDIVAERPDVVSVQPYYRRNRLGERQGQILAGNLSGTKPLGPGYLAWLESKGFSQAQFAMSGFVVDVADSGIDTGTTTPNHFGLYSLGRMGSPSRVAYSSLEGTPNASSTLAGCDGHGTLNAHIIAGYNEQAGFPFVDGAGYGYGLGICPFVKVGASVIFDPDDFTNPDLAALESRAYQRGARISNNSWGGGNTGTYDIDSQVMDALVRDAQPAGSPFAADGNQEMVVVVAAGNDGPGGRTIGSPASAKNVITVGASENVQSIGGTDGSGVGDSQANSANDMLAFSSRGPCSDGRHKPDLVAPGSHISGGVYQASPAATTGTAASCYNGTGVSGGASGSAFFPASQELYTTSSGTSHAAPAVSGACALLRQYFINQSLQPPSPAMTKAWFMNCSTYLTGVSGSGNLWSDTQGMGRLNLGSAFDGVSRFVRDQMAADLFTASGQSRTFLVKVIDSSKPILVTLAWTDAPGSTIGAAYNNDLDLVCKAGEGTYKGNVFSGQWSQTGGQADARNNVESVFLAPGTSSNLTVTVIAANIVADGVPQNQYVLDQDFALVVYNADLVLTPSIEVESATIVSETAPANKAVDPGEAVTLSFALRNVGTAWATNLVVTLLASEDVSTPSEPQLYGSLEPGGVSVERAFSFRASGVCGSNLTANLMLQDGGADLGTVSFQLLLGKAVATSVFSEDFDLVSQPDIPDSWFGSTSDGGVAWVTSETTVDTPPNALYVVQSVSSGTSEITSPEIVGPGAATLSFRNRYELEADSTDASRAYDGGVLEIRIGNGSWTDILDAGGTFLTGGYTRTIKDTDNPLVDRRVWSGSSEGFITTQVSLPPAVAGQQMQFRWRLGTDTGNYYGGDSWSIDTVSVLSSQYTCNTFPIPARLLNSRQEGDQFTFSFQTSQGQSYTLERCWDLNSGVWEEIGNYVGDGTVLTVTDIASGTQGFYRLRSP